MFKLTVYKCNYTYEGECHESERIIGTDESADNLRVRFNNWAQLPQIVDKHGRQAYMREFEQETSIPGNTGGGFASVNVTFKIEQIAQFDQQ